MLLIGFVWVIFATAASVLIKAILPGRWEDHGPTVMVVAAAGSSLTAMGGLLLLEGLNSGASVRMTADRKKRIYHQALGTK